MKVLQKHGLVKPGASLWDAPGFYAIKKDGGLRMCVDYSTLNKLTSRNTHPVS